MKRHSYNRHLTFCQVVEERKSIVLKSLSSACIVIFAEVIAGDDDPRITLGVVDWPDDEVNDRQIHNLIYSLRYLIL